MKPYENTEIPGIKLVIRPTGTGFAQVMISDHSQLAYADIRPSEVPAAALALYEAAGLPQPVILDAPTTLSGKPLTVGTPAAPVEFTDSSSLFASDGRVFLALDPKRDGLTPKEARKLGAALAVHADAAEAEPDPAEVEELAVVLHADRRCCVGGPSDSDRNAARAVLLAGWKREPER